jgi:hypothetical protein
MPSCAAYLAMKAGAPHSGHSGAAKDFKSPSVVSEKPGGHWSY